MSGGSPKGSEWRKWDLHLHSPGTKLNDQFRVEGGKNEDVWTEYCRRLHDSDVHAFGITDYFSSDGYFSTVAEYNTRHSDSSKVFFPNVELRTNEVVNKEGDHVNVHLLFNPFKETFKEDITKFLNLLVTNKTQGGGKRITAADLKSKSDFEEATTTRDCILEALRDTYGPKADLSEHVLTVTAANNDGIRIDGKVSGKKRKALISDELDKLSDGFFGNSGNVEWFLQTDRYENSVESVPKPTLTGCDAHSFADLAKKLGKVAYQKEPDSAFEPTWIKADLTYEGLRQIIFEPASRVFIGEEPEIEVRVRAHGNKYIDSLHATCIAGYQNRFGIWFKDERIPLGKELVAIIGRKGSGKSAIADIIGLLGNSHNQKSAGKSEELFSFLNAEKFRKGRCSSNFAGELRWHEGEPDKRLLDADASVSLPEKVEYLPQKYLERICANVADDEFRSTLNEVIFGYVKKADRYEKANFDDLIAYLTQQANTDIEQRKRELHQANEEVVAIEAKLSKDYRGEIERKIKVRKEDIEAQLLAKPREKPKPDQGTGTAPEIAEIERLGQQIDSLSQREVALSEEQVGVNRSLSDFKRMRKDIERSVATVTGLKKMHEVLLTEAGLSFEKIVSLRVDYAALDTLIESKQRRTSEVNVLLASREDIQAFDAPEAEEETKKAIETSIVCQRQALEERKSALMEKLEAPQREYQAFADAMAAWTAHEAVLLGDTQNPAPESLRGLKQELNKLTTTYPEALAKAKQARDEIAIDVFKKKKGVTTFYNQVKESIDAEISKHQKELEHYDLSIQAGLRFNTSFLTDFFTFVNQGVKGTFQGVELGGSLLKRLCDSVTSWADEDEVFRVIGEVVEALHLEKMEPPGGKMERDVFKQIKGGKTLALLYDFLYSFDYLINKYDLMVDQKDLSELSPGERGGLLLIFYLMLDKRDIPLVIDQPEDNLDNESVYQILAKFLKKAKKRRQIIMVTHNPNLAVGADAEQIIRVSIDKTQGRNDFDFFSGSIEDARVNKAVVDILEGTLPAFDNRRLKYFRR
jgi:ABC-type lipoprotein export system ATPase subunit